MKICTQCGKTFSDGTSFCTNCGTPLGSGSDLRSNAESNNYLYPKEKAENKESRNDFASAPVGINIISIIGFVLAFLCVGFVWVHQFSIIVFPVAVIALVLCTIAKAMKYDNIFAKVGFIVALVITIISGIVFGVTLVEIYY